MADPVDAVAPEASLPDFSVTLPVPPNASRLGFQQHSQHGDACPCAVCLRASLTMTLEKSLSKERESNTQDRGSRTSGWPGGRQSDTAHWRPNSCHCVPCPCPHLAPGAARKEERPRKAQCGPCKRSGATVYGRPKPPPLEFRFMPRTAGVYPRQGRIITGLTPPVCWAILEAGLPLPPCSFTADMLRPPAGYFDAPVAAAADTDDARRAAVFRWQPEDAEPTCCSFPEPEPAEPADKPEQPAAAGASGATVPCTNPAHRDEVPITFGDPPPPEKPQKKKKAKEEEPPPEEEPPAAPAPEPPISAAPDMGEMGERGDGTGVGVADLGMDPTAQLGDTDLEGIPLEGLPMEGLPMDGLPMEGLPTDAPPEGPTDMPLDAPPEIVAEESAAPPPPEVPASPHASVAGGSLKGSPKGSVGKGGSARGSAGGNPRGSNAGSAKGSAKGSPRGSGGAPAEGTGGEDAP